MGLGYVCGGEGGISCELRVGNSWVPLCILTVKCNLLKIKNKINVFRSNKGVLGIGISIDDNSGLCMFRQILITGNRKTDP